MSKPPAKAKKELLVNGKSFIVYQYHIKSDYNTGYRIEFECHDTSMHVYYFSLLSDGNWPQRGHPYNATELALMDEIKKQF